MMQQGKILILNHKAIKSTHTLQTIKNNPIALFQGRPGTPAKRLATLESNRDYLGTVLL